MPDLVLVTGNLGYIGPILVKKLKDDGYMVHGLDTDYFDNYNALDEEFRPHKQIKKDIRLVDETDLNGVSAVIHLAGLSNDPIGDLDFNLTYSINYEASVKLFDLCKKSHVQRFIFSSSCSIYGASSGSEVGLTEEARLNPVSAYAYSKVFFEKYIHQQAANGMCVTSMRNATIYGYSPTMRFDLVLNDFVARAVLSDNIQILSDGSPLRPMLNVEDFSRAAIFLLKCDKNIVAGKYLNIGANQHNFSVLELATLVKKFIGEGVSVSVNPSAQPDTRSYKVDFSALKNLAGGQLEIVELDSGLKDIKEWLLKNAYALDDLFGDKFIRLKKLETLREMDLLDADLMWVE